MLFHASLLITIFVFSLSSSLHGVWSSFSEQVRSRPSLPSFLGSTLKIKLTHAAFCSSVFHLVSCSFLPDLFLPFLSYLRFLLFQPSSSTPFPTILPPPFTWLITTHPSSPDSKPFLMPTVQSGLGAHLVCFSGMLCLPLLRHLLNYTVSICLLDCLIVLPENRELFALPLFLLCLTWKLTGNIMIIVTANFYWELAVVRHCASL